jgi:hypothetical protein
MSARPRTAVTRHVPPLTESWVHFVPPQSPPVGIVDLAGLDRWWATTGLRGAVLLHVADDDLRCHVELKPCDLPELTLNVLLRSRGPLLLADMPLLDVYDGAATGLATDDQRLVVLTGRVL